MQEQNNKRWNKVEYWWPRKTIGARGACRMCNKMLLFFYYWSIYQRPSLSHWPFQPQESTSSTKKNQQCKYNSQSSETDRCLLLVKFIQSILVAFFNQTGPILTVRKSTPYMEWPNHEWLNKELIQQPYYLRCIWVWYRRTLSPQPSFSTLFILTNLPPPLITWFSFSALAQGVTQHFLI